MGVPLSATQDPVRSHADASGGSGVTVLDTDGAIVKTGADALADVAAVRDALAAALVLVVAAALADGGAVRLAVAAADGVAVPLALPLSVPLAVRVAVAVADAGERETLGVPGAPQATAKARFLLPAHGAPEKTSSAASTAHAAWPTHAAATTAADVGAEHAALAAKAQPGSEAMAGNPYDAKDTDLTTWPAGHAADAEYDCCATPHTVDTSAGATALLAVAVGDAVGVTRTHAELRGGRGRRETAGGGCGQAGYILRAGDEARRRYWMRAGKRATMPPQARKNAAAGTHPVSTVPAGHTQQK